jgi:hypothetical protein
MKVFFLRYGEEISLDKVEHLMNQYRVPFYQVHLNGVKKQIRNCGNKYRRIGMLSLSIIETPVLALGTGLFGLISLVLADSDEMGGAVASGGRNNWLRSRDCLFSSFGLCLFYREQVSK